MKAPPSGPIMDHMSNERKLLDLLNEVDSFRVKLRKSRYNEVRLEKELKKARKNADMWADALEEAEEALSELRKEHS